MSKRSPVVQYLSYYKELSEAGIIRGVGNWFNAVGRIEFEKARDAGLIIMTKDGMWKINDKK
ncbi:MAG: hypothetical protein LVO36_01580 [Nitrosopumilus sp. (ex Thoosa mismalolli)]|nr:hypothetical protein [Nitrosopumilus sp. (ex Thoosa mismalolli)]